MVSHEVRTYRAWIFAALAESMSVKKFSERLAEFTPYKIAVIRVYEWGSYEPKKRTLRLPRGNVVMQICCISHF